MRFSLPRQVFNPVGAASQRLVPVLGIILLICLLQSGLNASVQSSTALSVYQPLTETPRTAQTVKTGLYAVNLYNLDPASNTYYINFYMWLKWKGPIDPIANLEFMNGVEDWSVSKTPGYDKPEKLADGTLYQVIRTEGRFREPFEFARYPLDQQRLGVTIENSVYSIDQLVYLGDTADSGYASDLSAPGWRIQDCRLINLVHHYSSRFGDPRVKLDQSNYSALRYELVISRPLSFFIWKLLLPLLIVLMSSWGALLLNPRYVESRTLLPVTALLTTVFLQQSYSDALPAVGYLVLLDKIYVLVYLLIIALILETIVTADWMKNDKPDEYERVLRLDRLFLGSSVLILVVGVGLLLL